MNSETLLTAASTNMFAVSAEQSGQRLDHYLSQACPSYSRSFLQRLILGGHVSIDGQVVEKASYRIRADNAIVLTVPVREQLPTLWKDEFPAICIVHEEDDFLVINKPVGISVHPGHEQWAEPTVVDWLLAHDKGIAHVGAIDRPGIVHRLDKDTSGLMIIARTNRAHKIFTRLFKDRLIHKTYLALVQGHPANSEGIIDLPIGRHPVARKRMTTLGSGTRGAVAGKARDALTHYQVISYYDNSSLLELRPLTGRTHQIRVHCAAIGHPLLGDAVYGSPSSAIDRHALHAYRLSFEYDKKLYEFVQEPPEDVQRLIARSARLAQ